MRQLLPTYDEHVDLLAAYRYPAGRPWVRANMVASLDGSAADGGSSRALSATGDQQVFGVLRGLCDVVLIGAGTARREHYRALRPRRAFQAERERLGQRPAPVLAVVSRSLDLDPSSPLFEGDDRTVVVTCEAADDEARTRLSEVAEVVVAGHDIVDISLALDRVVASGRPRVLCEGGPSLLAEVARAGRLDELCLTIAPLVVGGDGRRIIDGAAMGGLAFTLAHLLEQDSALFSRYVRA